MKGNLYNTVVKFINRPFCVECNSYLSPTGDSFERYECQCTLKKPHVKPQVSKTKAKFAPQKICTCDMGEELAAFSLNDEEPKLQKRVKTPISLTHKEVQLLVILEELHPKLFGSQENQSSKISTPLKIPSTLRMVNVDECMAVLQTMRMESSVSQLGKRASTA